VRSTVVGELTPGTTVSVRQDAEAWVSLSAPIVGWVSAFEVTATCVPSAP